MSKIENKRSVTRSQIVLFSLRLFFYFSVLILLSIHPGIAISFDRIGIMQWFVIVPVMSMLAFLPIKRVKKKDSLWDTNPHSPLPTPHSRKLIIAGVSLIFLSLISGGFSLNSLYPFLAGVISFVLTFLLFHFSPMYGARWGKLSLLEPFFLVWICLRLLALSRAGEEIANQSAALTQFILVWSAAVFLLHGVVVYFCLFSNSKRGAGKESALFAAGAAVILVLVLIVLPPDFIRNSIVENINDDRAPQRISEGSDRGIPKDSAREGRRPRSVNGREQELRGISEHNWQPGRGRGRGRSSGDGSDSMQYLVKIVVSETEPVYMGDAFKGKLDPVLGFLPSDNEPLNELSSQRLFATWRNQERIFDIGRTRREILSLSTLQERFLPYFPITADPTIISEDSGPMRFIHQVVSDMHDGNSFELLYTPSRNFASYEERALSQYTAINLNNDDLILFQNWLDNAMAKWQETRNLYLYDSEEEDNDNEEFVFNEHIEKILAIFSAFSEYQYNLSYDEETSINKIKQFIFETKDGDCVEFSNSAALLGRIAGVPSRVVTGFLAAEGLQTEAHLRGLVHLQRQIPFLQQFPFDNLFMVTNVHSHSWVQFYIPGYGWLDFEPTDFAIPPLPTGDANNFDVVIPIIEKGTIASEIKKFPWRAVLRAAGRVVIAALCLAYALRYGREAALYARSRKGGRDGARALYLLLLARLAADGKPIKPASKTASEYTDLFLTQITQSTQSAFLRNDAKEEFDVKLEHFKNFALLYSELRWRQFEDQNNMNEKFDLLINEYTEILKNTKSKGIHRWLIRILNLRGLAYL